MRRVSLVMLLVFALAGAAFAADDVIRIGVYNCLTGQNAYGGQLELEGTQLAHKEIPEVLGRKVELVVVDNK
ncbi:branched-chain amino acid ABC transporter substrate-binding protein, partial [Fretibacterium sp. OH1220_COT-178]